MLGCKVLVIVTSMQPSPLLWITVLIVLVLVLRCPNRKPSTDKFYKSCSSWEKLKHWGVSKD